LSEVINSFCYGYYSVPHHEFSREILGIRKRRVLKASSAKSV